MIPQRADFVPQWIVNQPLNIISLDTATHARLRNSYLGLPEFNVVQKAWYGTPGWFKPLFVSAPGHTADAVGSGDREGK